MAWLFLKWNSSLGVGFPTLLIYIRGQGSAKEVVIMRWKHPPWIHRILPPLPFYTQDVGIDLKKKRGIQSFSAFHRVQLLLTHRTIPFCLDPNQLASRRSFSSLHVSSMHAHSIPLSDSQRSLNLRKREKINISSREEKNHESRFRRIINLTPLELQFWSNNSTYCEKFTTTLEKHKMEEENYRDSRGNEKFQVRLYTLSKKTT